MSLYFLHNNFISFHSCFVIFLYLRKYTSSFYFILFNKNEDSFFCFNKAALLSIEMLVRFLLTKLNCCDMKCYIFFRVTSDWDWIILTYLLNISIIIKLTIKLKKSIKYSSEPLKTTPTSWHPPVLRNLIQQCIWKETQIADINFFIFNWKEKSPHKRRTELKFL